MVLVGTNWCNYPAVCVRICQNRPPMVVVEPVWARNLRPPTAPCAISVVKLGSPWEYGMKNLRLAAAAAVAGVLVLLSSGAAQAYPDCGLDLNLTIDKTPLTGGKSFDYVATAPDGTNCDWTVTYRGKTQTGSGDSISGTFKTKHVDESFTSKITATCTHDISGVSGPITKSNKVVSAVYLTTSSYSTAPTATQLRQSCPISADITLLPKGADTDDDDGGSLPNTGGSNLWILVLGGVLLVGGGGVIFASRRRSTH